MELKQRIKISVILVFSALLLGACSVLKPVSVSPVATYTLSAPVAKSMRARATPLTLLVDIPRASPGFGSAQMAYIEKPYQLSYFSQNSWTAPPALMLQPLIVQSLAKTGRYKAVAAAPFTSTFDLRLSTDVVRLQQDFMHKPSVEQLSVQAQLVAGYSQRIIATKRFDIAVPASSQTPYGGVIAANQAVTKLLPQLTRFVVRNSPRQPRVHSYSKPRKSINEMLKDTYPSNTRRVKQPTQRQQPVGPSSSVREFNVPTQSPHVRTLHTGLRTMSKARSVRQASFTASNKTQPPMAIQIDKVVLEKPFQTEYSQARSS